MTQDHHTRENETSERFIVEHRAQESRYVLLDRGTSEASNTTGPAADSAAQLIGEASYVTTDFGTTTGARPQRVFYHTHVDEAYSGQGLASVLVQAAVDDAIAAGFDIVPVCPYVARWFTKHTEYADRVAKVTSRHLAAIEE